MNFIYEDHRIYSEDTKGKILIDATFPFIQKGVVVVDHTYVDPSMRGQGVASELMFQVYKHAKSLGYQIVATCPYAVVWFKKHKEQNDIINQEVQAQLAPECQI